MTLAQIPWGIIISLGVVALAYFIKHFGGISEHDNHFWGLLLFFILIYVVAAAGIVYVSPKFSAVATTTTTTDQTEEHTVRLDSPTNY